MRRANLAPEPDRPPDPDEHSDESEEPPGANGAVSADFIGRVILDSRAADEHPSTPASAGGFSPGSRKSVRFRPLEVEDDINGHIHARSSRGRASSSLLRKLIVFVFLVLCFVGTELHEILGFIWDYDSHARLEVDVLWGLHDHEHDEGAQKLTGAARPGTHAHSSPSQDSFSSGEGGEISARYAPLHSSSSLARTAYRLSKRNVYRFDEKLLYAPLLHTARTFRQTINNAQRQENWVHYLRDYAHRSPWLGYRPHCKMNGLLENLVEGPFFWGPRDREIWTMWADSGRAPLYWYRRLDGTWRPPPSEAELEVMVTDPPPLEVQRDRRNAALVADAKAAWKRMKGDGPPWAASGGGLGPPTPGEGSPPARRGEGGSSGRRHLAEDVTKRNVDNSRAQRGEDDDDSPSGEEGHGHVAAKEGAIVVHSAVSSGKSAVPKKDGEWPPNSAAPREQDADAAHLRRSELRKKVIESRKKLIREFLSHPKSNLNATFLRELFVHHGGLDAATDQRLTDKSFVLQQKPATPNPIPKIVHKMFFLSVDTAEGERAYNISRAQLPDRLQAALRSWEAPLNPGYEGVPHVKSYSSPIIPDTTGCPRP